MFDVAPDLFVIEHQAILCVPDFELGATLCVKEAACPHDGALECGAMKLTPE